LFVLDVFAVVERLESFPQSGRVVPEKKDPQVREILLGNYRIIYRLREHMAELLTIHHGARLLDPTRLG
jgi:plasmid stabilization system protein ParE